MKLHSFCSFVLVFTSAFSTLIAQISTRPADGIRTKDVRLIALTNATIIPAPGERIDSGILIIRNERIESLGKGLPIPEGSRVVDMHGKWIYAAFVDPYLDASLDRKNKKISAASWDEDDEYSPPKPGVEGAVHWNKAVKSTNRTSASLSLTPELVSSLTRQGYGAAGFGSHDGIFRGSACVALVRTGSAERNVVKDNIAQLLSFSKGNSSTPYPSSLMGSIALLRQTFSDAAWYGSAHDAARRLPSLTPPETNHSLAAIFDHRKGAYFAECRDEHDLLRWKQISDEFLLDITYVGSGSEYRRLERIAPFVPRIILPLSIPRVPDVRDPVLSRDVSTVDLIHWYWAVDNPRLLDSVGCRISFTTKGSQDDRSVLDVVRDYVSRGGLSAETALAALTVNPASFLFVGDRLGKLAPGYYANLIIADGDLFNPLSEIETVYVAGSSTSINPAPAVDVRGYWTITSGGLTAPVTVVIKGETRNPNISTRGSDSREKVVFDADLMRFTLKAPTTGDSSTLRIAAIPDSVLMSGTITLSSGERFPMMMRRDSIMPRRADSSTPPPIRRQIPGIRPLGPFGYDRYPEQSEMIFRNATVWSMGKDGVMEKTDVHVKDGRIFNIGNDLAATVGIEYECSGMHITPGIIDEHSHIAISRGVNEGTHAVTSEVRIGDVVNPDDVNIYRQLAGGVTATHLLHGSANPIGGQAQFIRMRWGADAEGLKERSVPATIKFALGENVKQSNWGDKHTTRYPQTRMGVEEIIRDAFVAAREYEAEKTLPGAGATRLPVRRNLQLEALAEILRGDRHIHCHSYVQSEILMLMRLAEQFGFRIHTFTHILEGYKVASEMAKHGATASSFSDWWAYKYEVRDAIPQNPAIMHEQGVMVTINSDDAEMARRLNQEAAKSIPYGGVDDTTALSFVTSNAARQMYFWQRTGSLDVGKDADLVLWSAHPLSSFSRVEKTLVEGRLMFSLQEDERMRKRDAELRYFLEQEALKAISAGAPTAAAEKKASRLYHCDDIDHE